MSNTIMSCAVWCEVHGPVNIFCTQTSDINSTIPFPPAAASSTTSSNPIDTPLHAPSAPPNATSPTSKGTCASCSLYLPPHLSTPGVPPTLRTRDGEVTYLSTRHPQSQERYKAVRNACIRALSCESIPGRTGPIFFGDPSIGYTIAYIFRLADSSTVTTTTTTSTSSSSSSSVNAHHGRRQYALMCTAAQEQELLQSWTFITERFKILAQKIVEGSESVAQKSVDERNQKRGSGETVSMDRDRSFLRPKGRVAEKGLAELIGMEDIFVQLHAVFAWMLGIWRIHFEKAARSDSDAVLVNPSQSIVENEMRAAVDVEASGV